MKRESLLLGLFMKYQFPLKVAIIDDEPEIADLYVLACQRIPDFDPIPFVDPLFALEEISKHKIPIVLTDIDMPGLKGDDLIKKCVQNFDWSIDFVVSTALINMSVAHRCFRLGAREILIKPIGLADVTEALERVLHRYKKWNDTISEILDRRASSRSTG